ncbi:uncharacterized protein N7506_001186 [Penicillium brevicompactum]|uniref:uncharacterized protein n=1 Tax=Penicillium brevicompactum TaxID=5074 RepID=UPI0025416351|nr:uncharacterized protein N7506_001186 [Penicillium brevicompactum]KAJ5347933.1 hypothetical protein N7506_001186 [Penicillium brevicompactum]
MAGGHPARDPSPKSPIYCLETTLNTRRRQSKLIDCRARALDGPDFGWGPKRRPRDQPREPSVVLETAYTKAEAKLQSDVQFWLFRNDSNTNACLTAKIDEGN